MSERAARNQADTRIHPRNQCSARGKETQTVNWKAFLSAHAVSHLTDSALREAFHDQMVLSGHAAGQASQRRAERIQVTGCGMIALAVIERAFRMAWTTAVVE